MQLLIEQVISDSQEWQYLCKKLRMAASFSAIVLTARLMGLWIAKAIIEQQLAEHAQAQTHWNCCLRCNSRLVSKGFACQGKRILFLKGRLGKSFSRLVFVFIDS